MAISHGRLRQAANDMKDRADFSIGLATGGTGAARALPDIIRNVPRYAGDAGKWLNRAGTALDIAGQVKDFFFPDDAPATHGDTDTSGLATHSDATSLSTQISGLETGLTGTEHGWLSSILSYTFYLNNNVANNRFKQLAPWVECPLIYVPTVPEADGWADETYTGLRLLRDTVPEVDESCPDWIVRVLGTEDWYVLETGYEELGTLFSASWAHTGFFVYAFDYAWLQQSLGDAIKYTPSSGDPKRALFPDLVGLLRDPSS